MSVRVASWGLNSTKTPCSFAYSIPSTADLRTSSRVVFIMVSMWRSLVEMNMWM